MIYVCFFKVFFLVCFFFFFFISLIRLINSHGIDGPNVANFKHRKHTCVLLRGHARSIVLDKVWSSCLEIASNYALSVSGEFFFLFLKKEKNLEYVRDTRTPFTLAISCWYKLAIWYLTFVIRHVIWCPTILLALTSFRQKWNRTKEKKSFTSIIEMKAKVAPNMRCVVHIFLRSKFIQSADRRS